MKKRNFITQSSLLGTVTATSPAGFLQAQSSEGPEYNVFADDRVLNLPGVF